MHEFTAFWNLKHISSVLNRAANFSITGSLLSSGKFMPPQQQLLLFVDIGCSTNVDAIRWFSTTLWTCWRKTRRCKSTSSSFRASIWSTLTCSLRRSSLYVFCTGWCSIFKLPMPRSFHSRLFSSYLNIFARSQNSAEEIAQLRWINSSNDSCGFCFRNQPMLSSSSPVFTSTILGNGMIGSKYGSWSFDTTLASFSSSVSPSPSVFCTDTSPLLDTFERFRVAPKLKTGLFIHDGFSPEPENTQKIMAHAFRNRITQKRRILYLRMWN